MDILWTDNSGLLALFDQDDTSSMQTVDFVASGDGKEEQDALVVDLLQRMVRFLQTTSVLDTCVPNSSFDVAGCP